MNIQEVLEQIVDWRQKSRQHWNAPDPLSLVATELAYWNAHLAEKVPDAHQTATDKQITAHLKYRKNGMTQGDAELNAKKESLKERSDFERLKAVHKSTSDFISTLQSRLRILSEQARGNQ